MYLKQIRLVRLLPMVSINWLQVKSKAQQSIINKIYELFDLGEVSSQKFTELLIALRWNS
jgi:hypothetical protein